MSGRQVLVVGGGLAGITAALDLADAGHAVTLLEARPRLGGATASFPRGDVMVDTGQHVFLRCYTAYRGLLERLGVADRTALQPRLDIPVVDASSGPPYRRARLRRSGLPAPAHLLPALLGYGLLTPADRVRALRGAAALARLDPDDARLDAVTFGEWLDAHGQTPATRRALWDLVAVPALNLPSEQASLALAARVFRTGLVDRADAGDIGVPLVPLARLHAEPAEVALAGAGVQVRLATPVRAVRRDGAALQVDVDGGALAADAVVLATPHGAAARLLPPDALGFPIQRLGGLGSSPIVDVHVVYDRHVADVDPFLAVVGSPVQWVFDRTAASGLRHGQYLAVSVSAADEHVGTPVAALRETFLPALEELFPAAARAQVLDVFVTRERHATFRQAAGSAAVRPPAATRVPGLFLAGAWTATGWPDTMEGAVMSGHRAADALGSHLAGLPEQHSRRKVMQA